MRLRGGLAKKHLINVKLSLFKFSSVHIRRGRGREAPASRSRLWELEFLIFRSCCAFIKSELKTQLLARAGSERREGIGVAKLERDTLILSSSDLIPLYSLALISAPCKNRLVWSNPHEVEIVMDLVDWSELGLHTDRRYLPHRLRARGLYFRGREDDA